jgi:alpha-mannosidase
MLSRIVLTVLMVVGCLARSEPWVDESRMLTVHLIHHSHNDLGGKKTKDEHYECCVRDILNGAVDALLKEKHRRFSYAEMVYFERWFNEKSAPMQKLVRRLVKTRQLELVNGGWTSMDESCPTYEDMLVNLEKGHKFIQNEFGVLPRIGWQLDSYGHSSTNARFLAELGYDAWFFTRGNIEEKTSRSKHHKMEFLWRPSFKTMGERAEIFSHFAYES